MKNTFILKTLFVLCIILIGFIKADRYLNPSGLGPTYYADPVPKGSDDIAYWPTNNVDWYLHQNGAGDGFSFTQTESFINSAYDAWENVSTSTISFTSQGLTSATYSNDTTNVHYWDEAGTSGLFVGVLSGATAVNLITVNSNNELIDVDIVYNGAKIWVNSHFLWNDIQSVATHEIGHSLGFHHTDVTTTPVPVMTLSAATSSARRNLKPDDLKCPSFLYGGNIIDNETLSGTDYYNWDITVMAGKILTINSGSTINFKNGASLIVNGALDINGTSSNTVKLDFTSKTSTNGVKVYSGGSIDLEYAEIKNAKYGVYSNQGVVNIDNSNIHNCTNGVYLYNTNSASSDPQITNTYLRYNSSDAIYLYNSSPLVKNNKIEYNSGKGIYAYMYSDPEIVKNTIRYSSSYGVSGYYYSSVDLHNSTDGGKNLITNNSNNGINLGYYTDSYTGSIYSLGKNSIYSNGSYEVAALYGSNASVMTNYWGASSPPSGEFYNDATSSYTTYGYYTSDQGDGSSLQKTILEEDEISLAYYNLDIGNYDEAEKIFKSVLDGEFDRNKSIYALSGLNKCFIKANKKGFEDFLKQELKSKIKDELSSMYLELESYWLTEEGEYQKAIENFKKLQSDYKNDEELVENAKLSEALIYLDNFGDKNKAEVILAELSNKVNNSERVEFLANCIADYDEKNVSSKSSNWTFEEAINNEVITPTDYALIGNYPNPFNPSTTIKYSVPEISNVSLIIYDMMGREIITFENNGISAGQYSTIWDGTSNDGVRVSSGVYIYKFRAVSLSGNGKVFERASKLMMLK